MRRAYGVDDLHRSVLIDRVASINPSDVDLPQRGRASNRPLPDFARGELEAELEEWLEHKFEVLDDHG